MDNSKPLFSLTIGEFLDLNKLVVSKEVEAHITSKFSGYTPSKVMEDIIFIEDAMQLTGYRRSTLYSKVSRFEIPYLTRNRPLTFSRKALTQWIEEGKPRPVDKKRDEFLTKQKKSF